MRLLTRQLKIPCYHLNKSYREIKLNSHYLLNINILPSSYFYLSLLPVAWQRPSSKTDLIASKHPAVTSDRELVWNAVEVLTYTKNEIHWLIISTCFWTFYFSFVISIKTLLVWSSQFNLSSWEPSRGCWETWSFFFLKLHSDLNNMNGGHQTHYSIARFTHYPLRISKSVKVCYLECEKVFYVIINWDLCRIPGHATNVFVGLFEVHLAPGLSASRLKTNQPWPG